MKCRDFKCLRTYTALVEQQIFLANFDLCIHTLSRA